MHLSEVYFALRKVTHFHVIATFSSSTTQTCTESMRGSGTVTVKNQSDNLLLFEEQGKWSSTSSIFSNKYQWSFDLARNLICLVHLRYGFDKPELLGEFSQTCENSFVLQCPYLCGKDKYEAMMAVDSIKGTIQLDWKVTKPKNSYLLKTVYCSLDVLMEILG